MGDKTTIRIGAGAGFWGDSPDGPAQLVRRGDIDYLILDYLAEITMSILARAKARNPKLGYATDFVTQVIGPLAAELAAKNIKVVANAGGCNPLDCCAALERELASRGVKLRVAAVIGDDVVPHLAPLASDVREMATGETLPAGVLTANAYLGAFPIARALSMGADIVVTGRCADSRPSRPRPLRNRRPMRPPLRRQLCRPHARTPDGQTTTVRLIDLAYARSGDKGDVSNIAVIARRAEYESVIGEQLTADAVAEYMSHVARGPVQRFDWPGLHGFNFLLERALGGGGVSSLRYDPQGKGHAQMLLEFPVRVPAAWNVVKQ